MCLKKAQSFENKKAPLAQLVEHLTLNQGVQGSSPWRCTKASVLTARTVGADVFLRLVILYHIC